MTVCGTRYRLQKYLAAGAAVAPTLNDKRLHPHSLRHTTAVQLLKADVDFTTISQWLGQTCLCGAQDAANAETIAYVELSLSGNQFGVSQYAFGLFIVPIEETFGWTRTEISASLSFAAVGGLSAPLPGRAMDWFGARLVLVISLVVLGLSFCLRPLMTELWHWYALSFMQFITFSGMAVLPAGRLVAAWFPHIRGRMTGIAATGNNVGGLVMPVFGIAGASPSLNVASGNLPEPMDFAVAVSATSARPPGRRSSASGRQ